jgi:hypothetical protein
MVLWVRATIGPPSLSVSSATCRFQAESDPKAASFLSLSARIPDGALHRQNDCRVGQLKLYFENIKQYLRGIK